MKKLLVIALALCSLSALAQKPKVLKGDFDAIKSMKTWDVDVILSDDIDIHKKGTHKEFLEARRTEYNKSSKDGGEQYVETWTNNFNDRYSWKFCELMNKYQEKFETGVTMQPEAETFEGKIVIEPTWIYLGYINPMTRQPSKVTTEISFQDKDGNELCRIRMEESPGDATFTAGVGSQNMGFGGADVQGEFVRLAESFAKCGKDLSGYLGKKVYK
jgi:hypothetical protein